MFYPQFTANESNFADKTNQTLPNESISQPSNQINFNDANTAKKKYLQFTGYIFLKV